MFVSIRDFYRRHRRKLWMSGVVIGGVYAAGKYISYKVDEWQTVKLQELQSSAKQEFHFESNQKVCTETFISFLPNIRNVIMERLDAEQLLEILKMKPENKLEIWDQLKIFSFTRLLCAVIVNVILLVTLKVKMNVIGAYVFTTVTSRPSNLHTSDSPNTTTGNHNMTSGDSSKVDDMSELQLRYLNNVRYLVEEKLPSLIDDCRDVVEQCLSKITLKDKLSHDTLKEICKEAVTKLKAKHTSLCNNKHEFCTYMVDPAWTESEENNDIYSRIISETVNILEGIDCSLVIDTCLDFGLDQVLDEFKEKFVTYEKPQTTVTLETCLKEDFKSTELPVPKIIPILNNQIHEIFKAGANGFLDVLFSQDLVRQLSRNVYDSISKEYA